MNHELIMLRGANRMKYCAVSVSQEIMNIALTSKYNASVSTLYRKLTASRIMLRSALDALGYGEQWFDDNFGCFEWISAMRKTAYC